MTNWRYCPECRESLIHDLQADGQPLACPHGHFKKYDNPLPSTIGVIERSGRYLLVKRAREPMRGKWDAVGGFLQGAESPEDCLRREALEETGLHVTPVQVLGAFSSVYGSSELNTVGIAYRCAVLDDSVEIHLSGENSAFEWFAPDAIPQLAFADVEAAFASIRAQASVGRAAE